MERNALDKPLKMKFFTDICNHYSFVIGGCIFPIKTCHKVAWASHEKITENEIELIAVGRTWRRNLFDVQRKTGANKSCRYSEARTHKSQLKKKLKNRQIMFRSLKEL